ncbi:MAG: GAF domain-containing protein [Gammaproteobacteria bacterium]
MDKQTFFKELEQQAGGLLAGETDRVANAANLTAVLFEVLADVNWVGVYYLKDGELVVGPFQGRPACVRIPIGKGVCGTAAERRESVRVADVHEFEGHIACDPVSRSELVVPLLDGDTLIGVLDLDSPLPDRFDEVDQGGLERIAAVYVRSVAGG